IWAILDDTKAIRQVLGDEWSYRLTVIIRAAMLSARPNIVASKDQFQHIDAYDASRYRPQIVKILEDWGLDTELYLALIDEVVFSRAEASKDARGTVTAEAIAGWKAELADAAEAADAEAPSKFSLNKNAVAEHFTDKAMSPIDPELVDRFVNAI